MKLPEHSSPTPEEQVERFLDCVDIVTALPAEKSMAKEVGSFFIAKASHGLPWLQSEGVDGALLRFRTLIRQHPDTGSRSVRLWRQAVYFKESTLFYQEGKKSLRDLTYERSYHLRQLSSGVSYLKSDLRIFSALGVILPRFSKSQDCLFVDQESVSVSAIDRLEDSVLALCAQLPKESELFGVISSSGKES